MMANIWWRCGALLIGGLLAWGCGSGITALTGNLPPVTGRVYLGEDPEEGIADVEVRLVDEQGEVVVSTRTDGQGEFSLQVDGLGQPLERLRLEVTSVWRPRPGHPGMMEELFGDVVSAPVPGDRLLISMRPRRLTPDLSDLRLEPAQLVVQVGDPPVQFQLVSSGELPPATPTWILRGRMGVLTPLGRFTPERSGSGQVFARLGHLQAEAQVTVLPARAARPSGGD